MSGDATQVERVIKAARSFRGVCQPDFEGAVTIDRKPRITRLAARIHEAEQKGYVFERLHRRHGFIVYRLVSEPDAGGGAGSSPVLASPAPPVLSHGGDGQPDDDAGLIPRASASVPASTGQPGSLFEPEPVKPRNPYEEDLAA